MPDRGNRFAALRTIRFRATLGGTIVVVIALAAAAAVQLRVVRDHLVDSAEDAATSAAIGVAEQARAGTLPRAIPVSDDEERFVQVLDDRGVTVAASANVNASGALVALRPERDDDTDDGDRDERAGIEYDTEAGTFANLAIDDDGDARWRVVALEATSPDGPRTVLAGSSLESVDETVATLRRSLLLGVPLLVLLVAAVVLVVVRRSLRPVDRMRADLQEISSRDLHRRVTVPAPDDEIHRLGTAMNDLLERLEASSDRQRRFVADASHELRSPLASVHTQLDVALTHPDETDWDRTARSVLHDTQRVEALAADLLTLAQLDDIGGRPTFPVDLGELVVETLSGRITSPGEKPVRLHLEPDVVVDGQANQLARVVQNLVDNAQRHATAGIDVTVRRDGDDALIEVADDGPGIVPGVQEVIFQRFTRLDDARTRDRGGAGLGLAIVREVVVAHGGAVSVSDPPGATFRVTLPLVTPPGTAPPPPSS